VFLNTMNFGQYYDAAVGLLSPSLAIKEGIGG
jgi:hypothetical protein